MIEPAAQQPFAPSAPGSTPPNTGAQLASGGNQLLTPPAPEVKSRNTLIETLLLVIISIVAVVFIVLYIQKFIEWSAISADLDAQIKIAVAQAEEAQATELEAAFAEREKSPYKEFVGPADYGSFGFQYPRTWSVYIAEDAANGGDFVAYFNPGEIQPISASNINALRMRIRDTPFDSIIGSYNTAVKNGTLTLSTRTIGGVIANVYTGTISQYLHGAIMVMKLRDKTVILQTDADIFLEDFYRILESVTLME